MIVALLASGSGGRGTTIGSPTPSSPNLPSVHGGHTLPEAGGGEGFQKPAAVGTVAGRNHPPPFLPSLLQTPGKSEFLWKLKLCLLDQTGGGWGLPPAKVVGMEGATTGGWRAEAGRAFLLPARALGASEVWGALCGAGLPAELWVVLQRSGASRQGVRGTLPSKTRRRMGSSLAVAGWFLLQWRRHTCCS